MTEAEGHAVANEKRPHVQFAQVGGRVRFRLLTGGKIPGDWQDVPKVSTGEEPVAVPLCYGIVLEFARPMGTMSCRFRIGERTDDWLPFTRARLSNDTPIDLLIPWVAA